MFYKLNIMLYNYSQKIQIVQSVDQVLQTQNVDEINDRL